MKTKTEINLRTKILLVLVATDQKMQDSLKR